ncbi:MAG: cell division protein FtsZ [Thermoplasmataceae archaeon]
MKDIVDLLYMSAVREDGVPSVSISENFRCPEDDEIDRLAMELKVRVKVIGCGGAGSNTVNRLAIDGFQEAKLIALNTDANHLMTMKTPFKALIGKNLTRGLGTGADPQLGEDSAIEDLDLMKKIVGRSDIVFITCGMGGGTGTGTSPIVAKLAKESGALVISIVTLPFSSEGKVRMENAQRGLEKLAQYSDTIIAIPNDRVLMQTPKMAMEEAFKFADSVLIEEITGMIELVTKTSLVNLDFNDLLTVTKNKGSAMIGIGEGSSGEDRVAYAVDQAIKSPLVEADISQAKGCLVRIVGGKDMTMREAMKAAQEVRKRIDPHAEIIWGAHVDYFLGNKVKVMILLTGVKSPYIISGKEAARNLGVIMGSYTIPELGLDLVS